MRQIIGIDFDNTIICYDKLMHKIALERSFISGDILKNKKVVRDSIRKRLEGEIEWQKLQASVYGRRIMEAEPFEGVQGFFALCKESGVKVYIVSHKTEYASQDMGGVNLREAALEWMLERGIIGPEQVLDREDVFFESTRHEKCERIEKLGCAFFIDDLEEVFLNATFPADVGKVLYDPHIHSPQQEGITVASSWEEIRSIIFDSADSS